MSVYKQDLADFSAEESQLVVKLSDFDFGDVIGKGGFGEVNRAIQKSTGRDVAIKQIFAERLEGNRLRRYIGEIKTMAKCDNMFLVPFVGFTAEPPYAIVSEYMPNGALDNYIRHRNNDMLSGTQLTAIAIGIAHGMIHIHSKNIIHRDLKAANILLDSKLFPRIADFGIARFEDSTDAGMTAKIGTPNYMAPELITSKDYTNKVDVYAYAMILYEMSENQRPFKGLKVNDIFQQVVQRDERPNFTRMTPAPLQKLIKRCWDRDPEMRPSFEEIFEEFRSGRVYFPDTRRYDITKFLQVIENDEAKRNPGAGIARPIAKRSDYSDDSSSYSYSDSPPPQKKYTAPQRSASSNSNQKEPQHKYIQENELESEQYSQSTESSSSESDHADEVLRNYRNPLFFRYLDYYAKTIDPSQFSPFYSPISTHIKSSTPANVINAVLTACYNLMKRNSQFIHLFASTKFFFNLPISNEPAIDKIVDCYSMLFTEYPKALGQQHCSQLTQLLEKRPEKMLILHSYYVKQLLQLNNPWPVLDNLFTVQRLMLQKGYGYLFLSLFFYLIKKYDIYAKNRAVHLRGVFLQFLNAHDTATLRAAYDGLSGLYDDVKGLDFTRINNHLKNSELADSVLSLLIRVKSINPNRDLLDSLLKASRESPKPWIVLLNIANTSTGSEFLLRYNSWMDECERHPVEVTRVFVVIFKQNEYRDTCVEMPQFTKLLKAMLATNDRHNHSAVTSIVRRCRQTSILLNRLADDGVIKAYVDSTQRTGTTKVYANALAFFDALSRIAYNPSYLLFTQQLVDLLSSKEHASDAITVIVSMSFYKECAQQFKERDLLTYFKSLEKIDKYSHAAHAFIKNLEKI